MNVIKSSHDFSAIFLRRKLDHFLNDWKKYNFFISNFLPICQEWMHYWLYHWIPNDSLKGKHGRQKIVSLLGKYSIHDGIALITNVDNQIYYLIICWSFFLTKIFKEKYKKKLLTFGLKSNKPFVLI